MLDAQFLQVGSVERIALEAAFENVAGESPYARRIFRLFSLT